ncbi:MAG: hypothetical protein ACI9N0_002426 [Ilumatobacter sp.]|jgi:hypothetical protein
MYGCPGKVREHRTWGTGCYPLLNVTVPHHCLVRHSANRGRHNYVGAMTNFHNLEMTSITGEQVSFGQFKDNFALVVNVASA